jgi:hypothetical protein
MCTKPILRQTDYSKPFFLTTDTSAYGVGAVLLQEGELNPRTKKPTQHPIAYYSATFSPVERNYDIYERELLAIMKALEHWRPHLATTDTPVTVLTDHTNLTFWKNPKKVNRRVARWFATLQDYNLQIKHVPGKLHAAPDMLSRPPNADKGDEDNQNLTLLPSQLFIRSMTDPALDWEALKREIQKAQRRHPLLIKDWTVKYALQNKDNVWLKGRQWVIPPEEPLRRLILQRHHDLPTKGHPGRDWTIQEVERSFWWPGLKTWVANYVKGCSTCQQNKTKSHPNRPPMFKIPVPTDALPFQVVAMDLITQLPKSKGYDTILTIVDHGCTRVAVFLPCNSTTTGEGVARLYYDHIYKWFGLPTKVISDRDPRFTSHFAKALCTRLGVQQNLSTAFHPQTDGLSERKNQWVELFLRHLTSTQQDDWADWLPIATAVHNHFTNSTTKVAPSEALLGYLPRMDYLTSLPTLNDRVEQRVKTATERRSQAKAALNKLANVVPPNQFNVNDRVWLEAKNLNLPYQTPKLAPKRHGPFLITERVSPVAYRLQLPPTWTIHDVFHAGLLTPYHETKEHGVNFTKPPPEIVDGNEEYEVEAVLNHRYHGRGRRLQYLIKWKGYSSADNTWEPAAQIFAPDLIRRYHVTHPLELYKKPRSSRRVAIRAFSCLPIPPTSHQSQPHVPLPFSTPPSHSSTPEERSATEEEQAEFRLRYERVQGMFGGSPPPLPIPPRSGTPTPPLATAPTADHPPHVFSAETILNILQLHSQGGTLESYRDMAQHLARVVIQTTDELVQQRNAHQSTIRRLTPRQPADLGQQGNPRPIPPSEADLPPYPAEEAAACTRHSIRGFTPNNGRFPDFLIPGHSITPRHPISTVVAPFIRFLPNNPLRIEGTIDGTFVYSYEARATPYANNTQERQPLPPWLLELLHPHSSFSDLLIEEALHVGDHGLQADLLRYRHFSEELYNLRAKADLLAVTEEAIYDKCDRVRLRLEAAQAGTRLQRLQNIANLDRHVEGQQRHRGMHAGRGRGRPSS